MEEADAQNQSGGESLSVVLSFFNESSVIPELVARLRTVCEELRKQNRISWHELIFINDASTDSSRELLESLAEGHDDLRLLNMSRNFGVSACVLAGLEHSTGTLVVYMDTDLQDPPEVIPEMLQAMKEKGADVVHTVRARREGESGFKLLITRVGYLILRYFATVNLQIESGDFKMLSRRATNQLILLREKRAFVRGLVSWIGFKQVSVTYVRDARFAGQTKFPILSAKVISNFFSSALISFSDIPLQLSSLLGALISAGSVLAALWLGFLMAQGIPIPDWSIPFAVLAFLSGVQLFSIGLLGLYVAAIHLEAKRRPNYIVESSLGFKTKPESGNRTGNLPVA